MKDWTALISVEGTWFLMAKSLVRSILMVLGEMSSLRYSTLVESKVHLESLSMRCSSWRHQKTCLVHSWWRVRSSDECISMLSM